MTRRTLVLSVVVLALVAFIATASGAALAPPSAAELFAHVTALTAPDMEGRASGTPGGDRAARYLADQLAAIGLKPGGDGGSFLQSFVVSTAMAAAADSLLERLGPSSMSLTLGRDWTPHGGSLAGEVSGQIVFVGYGVAATRGWDDYAGVDVRDRIALALDGAPEQIGDPPPSRLEKLIAARRHGARALLLVGETLPAVSATAAPVRVVSGTITPAAADALLAPTGKTASGLRAALAAARAPGSFATGVEARLRVSLVLEDRRAANVIGILPGTDPARAPEAIVLGAHHDHLGRAGGSVHPGADDNASGTAVVLGLARTFAATGGTPRTLVFALFAGEEEGLLGSAHYVRHPALPMERTIAMLNFDMVGRMRDRRLHVSGLGSGAGLRAVVTDAVSGEPLDLALKDEPFAASDHTSFYGAGAPVLFFTTGGHDDYHSPRDTADKINSTGMAAIAGLAARVVERLAAEPRPTFVKLPAPAATRRSSGPAGGAFLGISAAGHEESDGLRLGSVVPDTAAARAGLKSGDVIVRLDDVPINRFEDLRRTIEKKRPGDPIVVLYLRDGDDHLASAVLGTRP
ncbi:MAG TPA: M28 family peptidase [Methylomirabilota bacterium]|nr:M28 family peptidase [Methylomirabilota bacterium]